MVPLTDKVQQVKKGKKDKKKLSKSDASELSGGTPAAAEDAVIDQPTAAASTEKKKKKKLKHAAQAEASVAAATSTEISNGAVDAEDKPAKKKKKKSAAQTSSNDGDTVMLNGALQNGFTPDLSSGKSAGESEKKKKKRKAAANEDNNGIGSSAATTTATIKQKKKAKKEQRDGSDNERLFAAVGSVQLAHERAPIIKRLFVEHADVATMSSQEAAAALDQRSIALEGSAQHSIKPMLQFSHTCLPQSMLHGTRNFSVPSPIQSVSWPIILQGHDMVGIAATGSGKTLAFGLPALRHIAAQREAGLVHGRGPVVLAMAPTRELALQIQQVLEDAGSECGVSSLCVYGGVPKRDQIATLRRGVDIVVGTPGRLEDLMSDGSCVLSDVSYLVLDEADRMLDLGFEPHIRAIAAQTRADRQTLMFSATWPTAIQKLAAEFMTSPVKVVIGSKDLSASHSIKQIVEVIDPFERDSRLIQLLQQYHSSRKNRVIIFVLYKKEAPRVESLLSRKGWKAVAIHGDMTQHARTAAVDAFKAGTVPLLIATDVAARGLDIPDVEVVINYSFPLTTEDYVHRIGRTGRAGKTGVSHTFFSAASDKPRAGELVNVLREAQQPVPKELLAFGTHTKKKESKLYGAHFKDVDINAKATKKTFDSDDDE